MKEGVIYHKLKKETYNTFIKRVENSLEIGTPDMFFCNAMHSGWIESKQFKLPVRATTPIKIPFRQGQYNWLRSNTDHGGVSMLAMHTGDRIGYYFAIGYNIQEVYTLDDFRMARAHPDSCASLIRFVTHVHLQQFLEY